MSLPNRIRLLIVVYLLGGLALGVAAIQGHENVIPFVPAWTVLIILLMLWLARCPRCGTPATLRRVNFLGKRFWIWTTTIGEECSSCGQVFERTRSPRWKDFLANPDKWVKTETKQDPKQPPKGKSIREVWENPTTGEVIGRHDKEPTGKTKNGKPKHPHPFEPEPKSKPQPQPQPKPQPPEQPKPQQGGQ